MVLTRICLFLVLLCSAGAAFANEAVTLPAAPANPLARFVNEQLDYDISFLWFDRLATGRLRFRPGAAPGLYRAELEATTLGVASWVTGDRVQRYLSEMELLADGQLRSVFHESWVIKGSGKNRREKGKRYRFDYQTRTVQVERLGAGEGEVSVMPLPADVSPSDFLTAFYNFRVGNYGPLREGGHFAIPTFTRKGLAEIGVQLLTPAERPTDGFFPAGGLLARIQLDPEVLDTSGGAVYLWFDAAERPARGIVENVLGLGHVRGTHRSN